MDVSDSGSRDRCVLHSCYSAKKGTKVPRKCLPRTEDEDQQCRGGGGGGGRQPLWEPGIGRSSCRKLDRRKRKQPMPPGAQGWHPWLGVAIVPSDTVHCHRSRAQLRMHLKPNQCISCGLLSHVWEHQGSVILVSFLVMAFYC